VSAFSKAELSFLIFVEEPPVYLHWFQHRYRHHRAGFIAPLPISWRVHSGVANIKKGSLCCCKYREGFIAPLPTKNNNILSLKCSLRHWKQILNCFIAPLPTSVCSR
jgi:hypothetical protein